MFQKRPKMIPLFLACALLLSCASKPVQDDYPLIERVLRPMHGVALGWQKCIERAYSGECLRFGQVESYDVADDAVRAQLNEYRFVCKIAEDAFVPCKENGIGGFCKQTFYKKWFLGKWYRRVLKFIPSDDLKQLQDGGTVCFSMKSYSFGEM